jgi:hypothetical protein
LRGASATKQSIVASLDCFASLAMTVWRAFARPVGSQ